jgi:tetratricopeptide (TPR) repeat protein
VGRPPQGRALPQGRSPSILRAVGSTALVLLLAFPAAAAAPAPAEQDPLVAKAYAADDAGKREEALALLRAGLRKRPGSLPLHRAYMALMNNYGLGELAAQEYEQRRSSSPSAFNSYLSACAQLDIRATRAVVYAALKRGEEHPLLSWARDVLKVADLAANGKDREARERLDASGGAALDPAAYELLNSSLLLREGSFRQAKEAVARARRSAPRDSRVLQAAAFLELADGEVWPFEAVLDGFEKIGDGAWLRAARATAHELYGRMKEARAEHEAALLLPPDWTGWRCARISALQGLDRSEEAEALALEEQRADPTSTCAHPARVFAALAAGRRDEAEALAKSGYERAPRDLNNQVAWAGVLAAFGRNIDALHVWKQALKQMPRNPLLMTQAGAALAREGDCQGAEWQYLMEASNTANFFPSVNRERGDCALKTRNFDQALWSYSNLLRTGVDDLSAWWGLAAAHGGLGRLDEAERAYGEALKHAPVGADMARLVAEIADLKRAIKERDARLSGDAGAEPVPLKRVQALKGRPAASYDQYLRGFVIGVPWEEPLLQIDHGLGGNEGRRWSPDGSAVYWPSQKGLVKTDLLTGATSWLLTSRTSPASSDRRYYVGGFFVSPDSRRLYIRWLDSAPGTRLVFRLESIDLASNRAKVLHTSLNEHALRQDSSLDRLYFFGGVNWSLDPLTGKKSDIPRLGCTLDLDVDKGARRVACVTATGGQGAAESELAIVETATGKKQYLKAAGVSPRWSPDGKLLAYFWRGRQLRLYEPETGRILALDPGLEQNPRVGRPGHSDKGRLEWSPDSRYVYYELTGMMERGARPDETDPGLAPLGVFVDLERREAYVSDRGFFDFRWGPKSADALPLPPRKR